MTVYDCFLFLNELDLLELRLTELYDVVDYFIIIESAYSFKGDKRPMFVLEANRQRYQKFSKKILYFKLNNFPFQLKSLEDVSEHSHWQRENLRYALLSKFTLKHDDIVIVSDLDEIPRKEVVTQYSGPAYLELTMYRFYINLKCHENPWTRAKIVDGKSVIHNTFKTIRWDDSFFASCKKIENAGWHFTSCGKFNVVKEKLTSFTHYSESHIPATIDGLKNNTWVEQDESVYTCEIDTTYPESMHTNLKLWDQRGFIYRNQRPVDPKPPAPLESGASGSSTSEDTIIIDSQGRKS